MVGSYTFTIESELLELIETWIAAIRSDLSAETGETGSEDFHNRAAPPHPPVKSVSSLSRLSKQPCPRYPGLVLRFQKAKASVLR